MAKTATYIIVSFGLIVLLCAFSFSDPRQSLRRSYTREIGVHERTNHNDGPRVEEYLHSVGLHRGDAWCAAFVCWNLIQVNLSNPHSGYSPNLFPAKRVIYTRGKKYSHTPQPGDVMGIYFKDEGRIGHVGFIEDFGASKCITVEGNTNDNGSREGVAVMRKRRLTRQIYKISDWVTPIN